MRRWLAAVGLAGSVLLARGPVPASALGAPPVQPALGGQALAGDPAGGLADRKADVAAHPEDADAGRRLGDDLFRAGDVQGAENTWRAVVAVHPDDADTRVRLGILYAAEGRTEAAIEEYEATVATPFSVAALLRLRARGNDLQRWVEQVAALADRNPFDPGDLWLEANVLQAQGQPLPALAFYRRVVGLLPNNCVALIGRANDLIALRRTDEGIADLRHCLALHPDNYAALTSLGTAELARNDSRAALDLFDRALQAEPDGVDALVDRGVIEDAAGDAPDALRDDRAAIAADPLRPEPYANIALDQLGRGALVEAEATIDDGLRAVPDDGRLHYLLAKTFQLEGQPVARTRAEYVAALGSDEQPVVTAARAALTALATLR